MMLASFLSGSGDGGVVHAGGTKSQLPEGIGTDGNRPGSVWGMNLAAEKRFMNSWLTLSSR